MQKILLIGAGRSTSSLISYLLNHAQKEDWELTVGDINLDFALEKIQGHSRAKAVQFDISDDIQRLNLISQADIVISMLPARMHMDVARECIGLRKHMVTASYVSEEMKALDADVKNAGLVFMNEVGVDPGIDHMSAMRVLDQIRGKGGEMLLFESFAGGLVAPESDNNPWNYKFTWNPRNVVLAGQGTVVKFVQEGKYKYIPYHKMFRRTEFMEIEGFGRFEGYANRDSLKYREVYGLMDIPTLYRGTLRRPGFCKAWDAFVQLGATDDSYIVEGSEDMTYREFINSFLAYNQHDSVELKLMHYLKIDQDSDLMDKFRWLGLFDDTRVGLKDATPAQILQKLLEEKWSLEPEDKDMLVMYHRFGYRLNGENHQIDSSMVVIGDDQVNTAMAKTVGLPTAISTRLILNGTVSTPGVQMPIYPEVYEPVLNELEEYGITFKEKVVPYQGY